MILSEKANSPAKNLKYAWAFFLTVNFLGQLSSGMQLYFVNNRISRKCIIHIDSVLTMDTLHLIDKKPAKTCTSKSIVFMKIIPSDILVLDDPFEFPEFGQVLLKDNCQVVGIGKVFRLIREGEEEPVLHDKKETKVDTIAKKAPEANKSGQEVPPKRFKPK